MKFEKPIINITMFEKESVATQGSIITPGNTNMQSAENAANAAAGGVGAGNTGKAVSLAF